MSIYRLFHRRATVLPTLAAAVIRPLHHHRLFSDATAEEEDEYSDEHAVDLDFLSPDETELTNLPLPFDFTQFTDGIAPIIPLSDADVLERRKNDPLHKLLLRNLPPNSAAAAVLSGKRVPETSIALTGARLKLHERVELLTRAGDFRNALYVVRNALSSETIPTVFTLNLVLTAFHGAKRYDEVFELFEMFFTAHDIIPNIDSYNVLIGIHCDCCRVDKALELYQKVRSEAPVIPSSVTLEHLTRALINSGRVDEAVEKLKEMRKLGLGCNSNVFNIVIKGFLDLGDLNRANELFKELKSGCTMYDGMVNATFMDWYFSRGMVDEAMESYRSFVDSRFKISPVTCNGFLEVFLKHGMKNEACKLFEHMLDQHMSPTYEAVNSQTFNIMVNECFKEGRYDEAVETFRKAGTKRGSRPFNMDAVGYSNIIARFVEHGMISEAEKFFNELHMKLSRHDDMTYKTPDLKAEIMAYKTMIDVYLKEKRVDDALRMINLMVDSSVTVITDHVNEWFTELVENNTVVECSEILTKLGEREFKPDPSTYEIVIRALIERSAYEELVDLVGQMVRCGIGMPESLLEVFEKEGVKEQFERVLSERRQRAPSQNSESPKESRFEQFLQPDGCQSLVSSAGMAGETEKTAGIASANTGSGLFPSTGGSVFFTPLSAGTAPANTGSGLFSSSSGSGMFSPPSAGAAPANTGSGLFLSSSGSGLLSPPSAGAAPANTGSGLFSSSGGSGLFSPSSAGTVPPNTGSGLLSSSGGMGWISPSSAGTTPANTGTGLFSTSGGSGFVSSSSSGTAPANMGSSAEMGDGGVAAKSDTIQRVLELRKQVRLQSTEPSRQAGSAGHQPPVSSAGGMAGGTGYPGPAGQNGYTSVGQTGYVAPAGQTGTSPVAQTGFSAPGGQTGYSAQSGQTGYSPVVQSGFSSQSGPTGFSAQSGQTGYSPVAQTRYSAQSEQMGHSPVPQSGYSAPSGQTGYLPVGQAGYSAQPGQMGYSPVGQSGYPAPPMQTGYPSSGAQTGYSPVGHPGNSAPSAQTGYSATVGHPGNSFPAVQTAFSPQGQTGYLPGGQEGYSAFGGQTRDAAESWQKGYSPVTQTGYAAPPGYAGYSPQSGPMGYSPVAQTGYSAPQTGQMVYSPVGPTGYPVQSVQTVGQIGYVAPLGQPGFSPVPQTGHSVPPGQMGYPPVAQTGYSVQSGQMEQAVQTGYQGHGPINQGGFPGPAQQGYRFPR